MLPSLSAADQPAVKLPAQQLQAPAPSPNDSIVDIGGNFNLLPIPPAMTQVVASATGGGAVAINAVFLNEAFFQTTPTTNGSAGGSVTSTYGDGWSGKGYSQLAQNGNGIQCYGFTLVHPAGRPCSL